MTANGERPPTRPCPTCGGAVEARAGTRPFCSRRCKLVDLGRWFDEDYVIPGPDAVSFEGLPGPEAEGEGA